MASSSSPCAACKFLRRKCTQECVFAPYFPPDQPQKFANVHQVFGASNVAKILKELSTSQREDAVNSLAYEAEARLRDPVYGCVGLISILQHKLKQVQHDLINAKKELATYIGPSAMLPLLPQIGFMHHPSNPAANSSLMPYNMPPPMLGLPGGAAHNPQLVIREPQPHQQMLEAQQITSVVAAREQQEMMRSYAQHHHHHELSRFSNGGFDQSGQVGCAGFNQMAASSGLSPALALGSSDGSYQIQPQQQHEEHFLAHQLQPQLLLQQRGHGTQQLQRSGSEDGPVLGPS